MTGGAGPDPAETWVEATPGGLAHALDIRVYYEDTDLAGIVYYANYLKFLERGRSEALRRLGVDQTAMKARGLVFVVRRVVADWLAPARFDELVTVRTGLRRLGGARLELDQSVRRGETLLLTAEVTLAVMDAEGRPQRIEGPLRAALAGLGRAPP